MTGSRSTRKLVATLTAEDFERHRIWHAELPELDYATAAPAFENLDDDKPYMALTEYVLRDGTEARGDCFIYDTTGFTLFGADGRALPISEYSACSTEEALNLSRALGRDPKDIFPIHNRATVKVLGAIPEGEISLQPIPSINADVRDAMCQFERPTGARRWA